METRLLREKEVFPTEEVLKESLGMSYVVYDELIRLITDSNIGLTVEWRYYNDGKTWLCKVCYKKKTVFWLSVWEQFFKIGFYFTEKSIPDIAELKIDENIKVDFSSSKSVGKLIPLTIIMTRKEQIGDVLILIEYKKRLK